MATLELTNIPKEAADVCETLKNKGFLAFLVGGCVRDLLMGKKPKDWDVTTNALPEEIIKLFPHTHYENSFGTVGVVFEQPSEESVRVIEITPFRVESAYSDFRRPDTISFAKTLEEDLQRRDFTINALALNIVGYKNNTYKGQITDLYGGIKDFSNKTLKTVGSAKDRFNEDGLRILRAVRFATELNFTIDNDTERAIIENSAILKHISSERIRTELEKIVLSENPMGGFLLLKKLSLLSYVIPELEDSIGIEQNQAHSFDVWEHLLRALQHAAKKGLRLEVRLAALLHDIGKPITRRKGENGEWTFYGHEVVGAKMAKIILSRLKFPVKQTETIVKLVRWHMFFSDTEKITLSAVRRIITKAGKENIWDLMDLRACDRIGTGRPKENPYRLRKYQSMIEEALRDPISVGMLEIDGNSLINELHLVPGPKIGHILHALLNEVLDDPLKNKKELLLKKAAELSALKDEDLKKLGDLGKEKKEDEESEALGEIRLKYKV